MTRELVHDVEQFLLREARLLDEGRFRDWLSLLADDIRYWMPSMGRRYRAFSKALVMADSDRCLEREFSSESEVAILDETKESLERRVARLESGMAWAEDPPSRTRHLITNIEIAPDASESVLTAYCNFIVYRSRGETEQDFYVGARQDRLRRVDGAWRIAGRRMVLDQNVLTAKNLSIFF